MRTEAHFIPASDHFERWSEVCTWLEEVQSGLLQLDALLATAPADNALLMATYLRERAQQERAELDGLLHQMRAQEEGTALSGTEPLTVRLVAMRQQHEALQRELQAWLSRTLG